MALGLVLALLFAAFAAIAVVLIVVLLLRRPSRRSDVSALGAAVTAPAKATAALAVTAAPMAAAQVETAQVAPAAAPDVGADAQADPANAPADPAAEQPPRGSHVPLAFHTPPAIHAPTVDMGLLVRRARDEAEEEISAIRADIREQRLDLERREHRLTEREERLDVETRHLQDRAHELADHHAELDTRHAELNARREELGDLEEQRRLVLERAAGLTAEDARTELIATIANQARRDAAVLTRDIEREAQSEGELRARRIITGAIQRLATEQTAESVVSVLHLPSDEMKGRIIGREGRNIRTFEAVTGVNLIIDDTPEAVLLSCFDPVRREIGRIALEALVLDGRIHPQRIEDAHERARVEVEALCVRAGEDALVDVGITEMHHELVAMLGRLRYRTSYGQNVLKHLLESAHIAGMMASELGLDPVLMRRCALLHDVGKALTHEVEGSHAIIGAEVARKYGENDDVVHAIEAHHNEVEPHTLEAVLTQAADAISGGRPGARRESLEAYVKRLERLEEIGMAYEGVEKVFAMQAGREVRVMVLPDAVDDIQAQVIAREIAKQVEHELSYPGQIRVTVVRESRATEVAR